MIIVLTGASGSGKSALAKHLEVLYEAKWLAPALGWGSESIAPQINELGPTVATVVDAATSLEQVEELRTAFGRHASREVQ